MTSYYAANTSGRMIVDAHTESEAREMADARLAGRVTVKAESMMEGERRHNVVQVIC